MFEEKLVSFALLHVVPKFELPTAIFTFFLLFPKLLHFFRLLLFFLIRETTTNVLVSFHNSYCLILQQFRTKYNIII